MKKDLVEIETVGKNSFLVPKVSATRISGLSNIEQTAVDWVGSGRSVEESFKNADGLISRLDPFFSGYQERLEGSQLLNGDENNAKIGKYRNIVAATLLLLGGYKVAASLAYGHYNVLFTILLAVVGAVVLFKMGRLPRVTKLGKSFLDRLQLAFDDLKRTSQGPYIKTAHSDTVAQESFGGVDPLLLSVGLFGSGILTGTIFANYNSAFQKSQQQISSGGCGSGSACGSGCSSGSDGGGGGCGGGGCGGGGCGGGGCGG